MLLSNCETIAVLSLLPKKIKVLVLKLVVKFKSGHQNFIQISDLYQSCGMSLFWPFMSESDLCRHDNYGKSQL